MNDVLQGHVEQYSINLPHIIQQYLNFEIYVILLTLSKDCRVKERFVYK